MRLKPTLFQTIPQVHEAQRRRDPFGFAEVATFYADLLAPDLTNRQQDARWMTILCWSLRQVAITFPALNDNQAIYQRLRGLELRWVIQGCLAPEGQRKRQLPGKRAVEKLQGIGYRDLRKQMGEAQWRRYRSTGPYAAYRGLMQYLGLLQADAWTLTPAGLDLAATAAAHIPALNTAYIAPADDANGWIGYWLRRWRLSDSHVSARDFLPSPDKLLSGERKIIVPLLFAEGERRRVVADCMQDSPDGSHADLCGVIQRQLLRDKSLSPSELSKLEKLASFSRLADAAITALRNAYRLTAASDNARPPLGEIAGKLEAELSALHKVCRAWGDDGVWPQVDRFVKNLKLQAGAEARLHCLLQLHENLAGGLLWLRARDGHIDRVARYAQPPGGYYRFRLNALAHLALGCGVIKALPGGLSSPQEQLNEEDVNDD
jgi:hypothetical protein